HQHIFIPYGLTGKITIPPSSNICNHALGFGRTISVVLTRKIDASSSDCTSVKDAETVGNKDTWKKWIWISATVNLTFSRLIGYFSEGSIYDSNLTID
ncbi:7203_t:CDS:1, partial [Funneliformis geosporum]